MIQEDFERDFLKETIYLQESILLLKQELEQEIERNSAIIKVIKDGASINPDELPKVREYNKQRVYVGYDLPFDDVESGG